MKQQKNIVLSIRRAEASKQTNAGPKHLPSTRYFGADGKPLAVKQGAVGNGKPGKAPGLGNTVETAPKGG